MKRFSFFYSFILICAISINTSSIQASEATTLTLDEAVAQALRSNRQILAMDALIDVSHARLKQARAGRLPQVSLETSVMRSNAPMTAFGSRLSQQSITAADFAPSSLNYPSAITQYQSRIVVDVPLYHGGAIPSAIAQATSQEEANNHNKARTRQQIIYQVIAAYSDSLRAQHARRVALQAVKSAKTHVDTATRMLAKGMLLRSDVMDAEVHQLNAAVTVTQLGHRIHHAKDRLRQLLAMDNMNKPLQLSAWSGFTVNDDNNSRDIWVERGWQHRPELQQMQAQLDGLHAKEKSSAAAFKPSVGLQLTQEWNNNTLLPQHGNTTVLAALRWNVFAGGADRAALQAAEATSVNQQLLLDDMRQSIAVAIKQALRQQTETASRWKVRKQVLAQTKESLRIHTLRFTQGMENINTMLDAQTRMDRAAGDVVQARFDHQMARVQLMLASGILTKEIFTP